MSLITYLSVSDSLFTGGLESTFEKKIGTGFILQKNR